MLVKLDPGAIAPTRAHSTDAGLDLYSPAECIIPPGGSILINIGVHVALPDGTAGLICSKSGLNCNYNITSTGLLDVGYTGTIKVKLYNHGTERYIVHKGDKVSQLVVIPVAFPSVQLVDDLPDSERGQNGFGSTGR